MRIARKILSAVLLASMLLVPFTVLVACSGPGQMHACCRMMMRKALAQTHVQDTALPPCCQVKSSRPAPPESAETATPVVVVAAPVVEAHSIAPAAPLLEVMTQASPPPLLDRQATLCTLRI